jgi:2-hydroxychromene-2-carboxylate isomerase
VIAKVANDCGLDGEQLVAGTTDQAVKEQLRANTEEAIARGAYGSPTLFVGDSLYFGNDQLPLIRQALSGSA